jgi:hypothetical protein
MIFGESLHCFGVWKDTLIRTSILSGFTNRKTIPHVVPPLHILKQLRRLMHDLPCAHHHAHLTRNS